MRYKYTRRVFVHGYIRIISRAIKRPIPHEKNDLDS